MNHARNEWRRSETILETGGEDLEIQSKRVEKMNFSSLKVIAPGFKSSDLTKVKWSGNHAVQVLNKLDVTDKNEKMKSSTLNWLRTG